MRFKVIGSLAVLAILFAACEEDKPGVNYQVPTVTFDTTYILETTPQAQPREVLIEDITGTSCQNCPDAAAIIRQIVANNPNRVNAIGLYNTISGFLGNPIDHDSIKSRYNFKTEIATQICQMVTIPGNLPNGYINRKKFTGKTDHLVPKEEWASAVSAELGVSSPVNIDLHAVQDPSSKEITAEVTVTYTANIVGDHYITVAILEDSIIDAQEGKDAGGNVIYMQDYQHRHVLRDVFTASVGDLLNNKNSITLTRGRVIKRAYKKKYEPIVNYSKLKVVAFVHEDPTSKYVVQSKETEVE